MKRMTILLLCTCLSCGQESQDNKSPWILQATYDSGAYSDFVFRKDGTFVWTSGSGLGVSQNEGRYSIKDSIITLDKIGFSKAVKSTRLVLTSIHPSNRELKGKYVIQVDDENKLTDSIFIFTVGLNKIDSLKTIQMREQ